MGKTKYYTPRPQRPIICKQCGKVFSGKYCQCYCSSCLKSGTPKMNQLRDRRKEWIE